MTLTEAVGLALAILGLAFAFEAPRHWFLRMMRLHRKRHAPEAPATLRAPIQNLADHTVGARRQGTVALSVKEIVEAVRDSPLLQREEVSRNYVGISVNWTGYLRSAEADFRDKSRVRVNLMVDKEEIIDYSFWFSIELARVPELKVLRRNSKLRVAGTIAGVAPAGLSVDLEPVEVEVLEPVIS
ncbi:hypothetical protein [Methylibium sp.]|uniref:hypothetical protein n=1 Tax=Methylibium sp. TaxID=2067992 RepID=UPI003BAC919E